MRQVLACALLLPALCLAQAAEKPKMIVMDLTAAGGVEPEMAGALTDAIAAEVAGRGFFTVISSREVQTMLGAERQRQLLGCSEEAQSCLAELSGALNARFVLTGSVARLGDAYQLTLQAVDSEKARTVGRATKMAGDLEALRGLVPWAVAEATGTPLPPPPSRVLQYSLIGAGALLAIGGGIVGQDALSEARSTNDALKRGQDRPGSLLTYDEYQQLDRDLRQRGWIAAGALAAGAALMVTGVLTLPPEVPAPAGVSASLVPGPNGFAIVGTFR